MRRSIRRLGRQIEPALDERYQANGHTEQQQAYPRPPTRERGK